MASLNHSFNVAFATQYGIEEAILIHHFQYWLDHNRRMKKNLHEGKTWSYQTQESLAAFFPYFTNRKKVTRLVQSLVDQDVLIKGNFNKSRYDQTLWYAFSDEKKFMGFVEEIADSPGSGQKCPIERAEVSIQMDESVQPIPDTKTYTKTKDKREGVNPQTPRSRSASKNYIQRKENVKTTDEEHKQLEDKFGSETTEQLYEMLNAWKIQTPKSKWKKMDYLSILKWVVDAFQEDKLKAEKRKKIGNQEDNVAYAKRVADGFNEIVAPRMQIRLEATGDCLMIYSISPTATVKPTKILFRENGFQDQVSKALQKWRLT